MRAVYWFRRDLRLRDNRALARVCSEADEIIGVYVLTNSELALKDSEHGRRRLKLLFNSLLELDREARVHVFEGDPDIVIEDLVSRYRAEAVYTAKPLSWSEKEWVERVRGVCSRLGVKFVEVLDNVLVDPYSLDPGRSFNTFYTRWLRRVDACTDARADAKKFIEIDAPRVEELLRKYALADVQDEFLTPSWAMSRLKTFSFEKYSRLRDLPYIDGTSRLSPFINIGVLSVREVYREAVGRSNEFIRQLAWRDYYYAIWVRSPWMRDLELKPYMRGFKWENNEYYVKCFMEGKTGYPIVDAGIRQLKTEGWVHNRVRLILASFLVKDLLVDWRVGEQFFRKHLVDYDEVLNVGNWQWAASTGVDPLPVRVFNPIRQAERYDPLCYYIKKYIPELEGEDCRALHNPLAYKIRGYVEPIVDHYERTRYFLGLVKERGSALI